MQKWEKKLLQLINIWLQICLQDFQQRLERIEIGRQANYISHVLAYQHTKNVCEHKKMECS